MRQSRKKTWYILWGGFVFSVVVYGLLVHLLEANPNKLLNDLGGLRKKMKLDIPALKIEEIKAWWG